MKRVKIRVRFSAIPSNIILLHIYDHGDHPGEKEEEHIREMQEHCVLFLFLITLPLSLTYFFVLKSYVQIGNNSASDFARPLRSRQLKNSAPKVMHNNTATNPRSIQQVSCQKYQRDKTIYDPNAKLARFSRNNLTRLTVTEPKFWIAVHSILYDGLRFRNIFEMGEYYEKGLTALFHRILMTYDTTTKPPPLVLDIGANIGWFALYSRAHGHEVAAFEPNPTMFLRICESLQYNNWDQDSSDVSFGLWNYGLGAIPGRFNMTTGSNPGASSFHEERIGEESRGKLEVSVVTLDSIAIQEGWLDRQISLMKVDVEGFENYVFEGGKKLIYNGNVENIIMESSNNNFTALSAMLDLLYGADYRIKEIRGVNGDKYHEDWWHTFNPALEMHYENNRKNIHVVQDDQSDQIKFLAKVTCNIWWQHKMNSR